MFEGGKERGKIWTRRHLHLTALNERLALAVLRGQTTISICSSTRYGALKWLPQFLLSALINCDA